MNFSQTWEQVIAGTKTMTSRLYQPRDTVVKALNEDGACQITVVRRKGRILWQVGQNYAVAPGRGKYGLWYRDHGHTRLIWETVGDERVDKDRRRYLRYCPARIEILSIGKWDVRQATLIDVKEEGFETHEQFWETWMKLYDPRASLDTVQARPAALYRAWKLRFKLVAG